MEPCKYSLLRVDVTESRDRVEGIVLRPRKSEAEKAWIKTGTYHIRVPGALFGKLRRLVTGVLTASCFTFGKS